VSPEQLAMSAVRRLMTVQLWHQNELHSTITFTGAGDIHHRHCRHHECNDSNNGLLVDKPDQLIHPVGNSIWATGLRQQG
jgi:hypothetical protein